MSAADGARHLVEHCGGLRPGERVLVVGSADIPEVAALIAEAVLARGLEARLEIVPPAPMHGFEPPGVVAALMTAFDLTIGATSRSMAHTRARREASLAGRRYLSLPDYSLELLAADDLRADYAALAGPVRTVAAMLSGARRIVVTTQAGSRVSLCAEGRVGNACPGFVEGPGELGSPPDIEANVSPVEEASEGVIVVDGSIAHPTIGLLDRPVVLTVGRGRLIRWEAEPQVSTALHALFAPYPDNARVLAELGLGMNPRAKLRGLMLTDEGCAGAVHFGFGSNDTVGGRNAVGFHLDFCIRDATVLADGREVLREGVFAAWTGFPAVGGT